LAAAAVLREAVQILLLLALQLARHLQGGVAAGLTVLTMGQVEVLVAVQVILILVLPVLLGKVLMAVLAHVTTISVT
jgi:hypothetical protein